MATPAQVAGTVLVVTEIPNLFSGLLPSMFTISSPFFHEQEARAGNIRRIRQGEVIATIGSAAIIFAASELFDTTLVIVWGFAMVAALIACYEYALRNPASEHESKDPGGWG